MSDLNQPGEPDGVQGDALPPGGEEKLAEEHGGDVADTGAPDDADGPSGLGRTPFPPD